MAKKILEIHIIPSLYTIYVCIHKLWEYCTEKDCLTFFFFLFLYKTHILSQAHINIPCHAQEKKIAIHRKKIDKH